MSARIVFVCDVCGEQHATDQELTKVEVAIQIGRQFRVPMSTILAGGHFPERDVCNKCLCHICEKAATFCNALGIDNSVKGK